MPVVVIDYGAGNLKSVMNMLSFLGCPFEITSDCSKISAAQKIIFPGQGHFAQAMKNLEEKKLINPIKSAISSGVPFLGICLGLQVLFEKSEESPGVEGLSILKGEVKKFRHGKIPQIGWNRIKTTPANTFLTEDYFYFVNSYYVVPEDKEIISSVCDYHIDFCSSIQFKNLTAVQFHPEKSCLPGLHFFKNWVNS